MFGLFKSQPFRDTQLGEFMRSRSYWRGALILHEHGVAPLALAGGRSQPDPHALALARELPHLTRQLRPAIAQALFEHYQPYAEAIAEAGSSGGWSLPPIASPQDVWSHVALSFVSVAPLDGMMTAELGYKVAWDDDHTLGARLLDGRLLELCGSVVAP